MKNNLIWNKKTKRAASSISQKEQPEHTEPIAHAADAGWAEVEPKKARARRPEKVLDVPGSDPAWGLTMALLGEEGEDVNQKLLRMGRLCQWYISVQDGPCTVTLLSVFPEDRVVQFLNVSEQLGYIKAHGKNLWGKGPNITKIVHVLRSVIIMLCLSEEEKTELSNVLADSADVSAFMQAFYNKYGGPEKALEMLLARAIAKENAKEKVANNQNESEVKP